MRGVKSFKEGVNGIEDDLNTDSSAKKGTSTASSADSAKDSSAEKK